MSTVRVCTVRVMPSARASSMPMAVPVVVTLISLLAREVRVPLSATTV